MATITTRPPGDDRGASVPPIDTTVRLITPERIAFTYPLAGPFRRAIAYAIDLAVIGLLIGLAFVLSLSITLWNAAGVGLALAATFGLVWGYGTVCEGCCNGRTVGKRIAGLRVMTTQGVPISGSQAAIRNLIGTVDGPFPMLYLPGLISMFLTAKLQRLGDLAAGTMVIIEEFKTEGRIVRVADKAVIDLIPYLPMRVAATSEQARALADYVRNRARFGVDLREEIARPLAVPIRDRHALPATASGDAVLCAYYHRLFLGE